MNSSKKTYWQIMRHAFEIYLHSVSEVFPLAWCGSALGSVPTLLLWWNIISFKGSLLLKFILFFPTFWLHLAILFQMHESLYSLHSPLWKALHRATVRFFPCLLVAALYCLLVLVGGAVWVIPGILLAVLLTFAFFIAAIEGQKVFTSMEESHYLVWENFWGTAAIFFSALFIHLLIFGIALLFAYTLLVYLGFPLLLTQVMLVDIDWGFELLIVFGYSLISALLFPFSYAFLLAQYEALRGRAADQLQA